METSPSSPRPSLRIMRWLSVSFLVLGACDSAPYAELLEGKACTEEGHCVAGYRCVEGICELGEQVAAGGAPACPFPDDCDARPIGEACSGDAECASEACVDGVCCESLCDAGCSACSAARTGATDGTCAPVRAGQDPELECATGETCNGAGTCEFICGQSPTPVGGDCPPECTGGCSGGTCVIACNTEGACEGDTLTCPRGFDCTIECGSGNACKSATVECPSRYACRVDCTNGCQGMKINCSTGTCALDCAAETACTNARMNCGANQCAASCTAGATPPNVDCGESCGCDTCQLDNGEPCSANGDCQSAHCDAVGKVCCDTVCSGKCESCVGADTGEPTGVCSPIQSGLDPTDECPNTKTCDGSGACN